MAKPSVTFIELMVCAALAACSPKEGDAPPRAAPGASPVVSAPPCAPEKEKKVKVDGVTVSGTQASVTVDKEPAPVLKDKGSIRWTLKSPPGTNYAFTGDGIVFKMSPPAGAASVPSGNNSEYVWCFGATSAGTTWQYTIKFIDTAAPTKVWRCDPTIVSSATLVDVAAVKTFGCSLQ